jgi:hypothetical protein
MVDVLDGVDFTMNNETYSDKLVEISQDAILIHNYYFPFGSKRIVLIDIESITVYAPSLLIGKYRYWGTGDFQTWYPRDNRFKRDKIFLMKLKQRWWRIGFTVEDSQTALNLLSNRCPLIDNSGTE